MRNIKSESESLWLLLSCYIIYAIHLSRLERGKFCLTKTPKFTCGQGKMEIELEHMKPEEVIEKLDDASGLTLLNGRYNTILTLLCGRYNNIMLTLLSGTYNNIKYFNTCGYV